MNALFISERQRTSAKTERAHSLAMCERVCERVHHSQSRHLSNMTPCRCGAAMLLTDTTDGHVPMQQQTSSIRRGEPMNEEADTLAEVGREKEKETAKWTERTQRLIFKWAGQKKGKQ
jgi:hypothetical protein